jgi:glycine cleavage system aminomethyltransferase T
MSGSILCSNAHHFSPRTKDWARASSNLAVGNARAYSSIMDEHLAVRRAAGLFDISHMGEVHLTGDGCAEFLNRTLTNDLRKISQATDNIR